MEGGFRVDLGALRALAPQFFGESQNLAQLVTNLGAIGTASTGEGSLDGLITRLVGEVSASVGAGGMAFESDGQELLVNAANYEAADGLSR